MPRTGPLSAITLLDMSQGIAGPASMALWGKVKGSGARHIDISLLQVSAHMQARSVEP